MTFDGYRDPDATLSLLAYLCALIRHTFTQLTTFDMDDSTPLSTEVSLDCVSIGDATQAFHWEITIEGDFQILPEPDT